MRLSITARARLLNGALGAALTALLVVLVQSRVRIVLYSAVDHTLEEQARHFARGPGRDGPHRHHPERQLFPPDAFGPPFEEGERPEPQRGDGPRGRREMPPMRFGTTSLLRPRIFPLDDRGEPVPREGEIPLSSAGLQAARRVGQDLREEVTRAGKRLHIYSLQSVGEEGRRVLVQTAAELDETEAALQEISAALYVLILPLTLIAGVLGAMLTDLALAPVRQLTRAIASLEATRLTTRLPAPGGGDTFDQLVSGLNGLLGRLDAAFVRQKRFTADASHELRTPLAVVKAATSLLLKNPQPLTDLQRRTLESADQASDRANRLVGDLLLLARTDQGILPIRPCQTAIRPILDEAVREAITSYGAPHAPVSLTCRPTLDFFTDPDHLHRLVVNLVGNALRHTLPTGVITVTAGVEADPPTLEIQVIDTGEGIAPDALPRLGEPFFRPDAARARAQGGAGLGLALCKGIAAAQEGSLRIDSVVGRGTVVQVRLPSPEILPEDKSPDQNAGMDRRPS